MTRKHPNARRAIALAILTSLLLAANAGALFNPSNASAATAGAVNPGRSPLPGDPNIPDEGGRSGSLNAKISDPKPSAWVIWIKHVAHYIFLAR